MGVVVAAREREREREGEREGKGGERETGDAFPVHFALYPIFLNLIYCEYFSNILLCYFYWLNKRCFIE